MSHNQTINGVPRTLLESFAAYVAGSSNAIMRARGKELRALLDEPAPRAEFKKIEMAHVMNALEDVRGKPVLTSNQCHDLARALNDRLLSPLQLLAMPAEYLAAAQPQGEPWRTEASQFLSDAMTAAGMVRHGKQDKKFAERLADCCVRVRLAWLAEQPAPVAAVPDGYCIMPRQLTAENGAKALLLGEFKLLVTKECPECCELEEPVEGCSICDGEGEYGQKHTIPWDQIKFIYSKAVSGLAVNAESAKT